MKILLETIKTIITDLNISKQIDEELRRQKPPVRGYDIYSLEEMILKLFELIASEVIYNIDLWRQEIQYGTTNLPNLKKLVQDNLTKQNIRVRYGRHRGVIINQKEKKEGK